MTSPIPSIFALQSKSIRLVSGNFVAVLLAGHVIVVLCVAFLIMKRFADLKVRALIGFL